MKFRIVFICLIFVTISSSCQDNPVISPSSNGSILLSPEMESSFQEMINIDNINNEVVVTLDEPQLELRISSNIDISIENVSQKRLYFPVDKGVKLFTIHDDQWIQLENNFTYAGNPSILEPNGPLDFRSFTSMHVSPDFTNTGKEEFLRIVIIGEELSEAGERTGIPVAATIDLMLNP